MRKIIDGIRHFQESVYPERKPLFEKLASGQQPLALFITCADSRIDPNLVTQTEPGELFIIRNAGNIVPPHGALAGGEAATVEYAVSVLRIRDIIVCGHSHCGAMQGLLHPEAVTELGAVQSWLSHARSTSEIVKGLADLDDDARLAAAIEQNVLVQLDNLRTHPSVAAATARGDLQLHGWTYHFETGQVLAYEREQGRFLPLDQVGDWKKT